MRRLAALTLAAVLGIILALTLWPSPHAGETLPITCFYCSERATADAIANVILFAPLGVALAWMWPALRRPWSVGLGLSLAIELLQLVVIPGRDPSIGDVVTNSLGAQLGWSLYHYVAREQARPPRAATAYLAGSAFAGLVALVAWLFGPSPTNYPYFGQWTPTLGHLEWYRGRVLAAMINGEQLRVGPIANTDPTRAFVERAGTLIARAVAGPPVVALAPLVSIYDRGQREILLLGPDRDALVLRFRRRFNALLLDGPDVRLDGAFAGIARGDTITVAAERLTRTACLRVDERSACLPLATPGRGWSLVYFPESFPTWLRHVLDALWLLALALPVGWCGGFRRPLIGAAVISLGALVLVPLLSTITPSPPAEVAAALAGLTAGALLRRRAYPATASASTATQRSMRS
jgi:hypothetical protein